MCCKLNRFCCCAFSLQTGTKVIANVYLLIEVLVLTYFGISEYTGLFSSTDLITMVVLAMLSTILVLISATKDSKASFLMPWLFMCAILILGGMGYVGWIVIQTGGHAVIIFGFMLVGLAGLEVAVVSVASVIGAALFLYNWLVVFNYYHHLVEKKRQPFEEDAASISYIKYP
ncbi:uncharacterized protein LOC116936558 [Daphnia magna]|uniref:Uncharacterized protein n=2 Tax=Daphnia magna TaxID=35525 RepID=A0A164U0H6_9CRUS|nr:uncharacterized protein LOC116936558 [Daphnia magna]KAK4004868.1 hypothetical protein OUZ56_006592 [Daphnia magna]KZS10940.1 Uncharacterized protein APZ42_024485 [Daphnia magna]